jgi:predicted amidohydrolase
MSTLRFSLIQTPLHWENKTANLNQFSAQINEIKDHAHIIVLPEMFNTGFTMNPAPFAETMTGDTIQWMQETAKVKKSIITGSLIIKEEHNGKDFYHNRLIWMQPDGQWGYYDKRHLFGYAGEDQHYIPGYKRVVFSVGGWKILPLICYDLRFPVWSRQQISEEGVPEYDVLLYIANWPAKRIYAWRSLLIARAIENQCYVVAVNRTGNDGNHIAHNGNSMVITPMGEVLFESNAESIIQTITLSQSDLENSRKQFPFLKEADYFQLLND